MNAALYRLIAAAAVLSVVHHVDHILRGLTGWPLTGHVNPFTYSLLVYPVLATGLVLSWRGRVGPRFWACVSAGGALFLLSVHVGPLAADSVSTIPGQYASPVAGAVALVLLVALVAVLAATFVYEVRLASASRQGMSPSAHAR